MQPTTGRKYLINKIDSLETKINEEYQESEGTLNKIKQNFLDATNSIQKLIKKNQITYMLLFLEVLKKYNSLDIKILNNSLDKKDKKDKKDIDKCLSFLGEKLNQVILEHKENYSLLLKSCDKILEKRENYKTTIENINFQRNKVLAARFYISYKIEEDIDSQRNNFLTIKYKISGMCKRFNETLEHYNNINKMFTITLEENKNKNKGKTKVIFSSNSAKFKDKTFCLKLINQKTDSTLGFGSYYVDKHREREDNKEQEKEQGK